MKTTFLLTIASGTVLLTGCGTTAAGQTVMGIPYNTTRTSSAAISSAAPSSVSPSASPSSGPSESSPSPSLSPSADSGAPSSSPATPTSSATPSLSWVSTPLMLSGNQLGTASFPSTWNAVPSVNDGGGSGATLTWTSPGGANQLNVQVNTAYGANHNVTNGSDAFDPSLALPQAGCAITAIESNVYPFSCQGFQGFVYTAPTVQGAITVWTAGPNGPELSHILNSVQLSTSDLSPIQGG